ncbi:unnamed protein product [Adineta ricciae]|uniref:Uncharacterized protein n=1 Tax=Adineta ricciae TaxID=249248 RepID=A0A815LHR1_ADIRI|nr:unnamed protein product [Adineta ricciae]CAF1533544.1 unnamed protein product [Adineta ricciae]
MRPETEVVKQQKCNLTLLATMVFMIMMMMRIMKIRRTLNIHYKNSSTKHLSDIYGVVDWMHGNKNYFQRNITICQVERQSRVTLISYVVHDCTAVTEIYRAACPGRKTNLAIANKQQHIPIEFRKTTPLNHCYPGDLSDVSGDEIELYLSQTKVKYQQGQTSRPQELAMELELESDFELETDPEQQPKRTEEGNPTTK